MKVCDLIDPHNHTWNLSVMEKVIPTKILDDIRAISVAECTPSADLCVWSPSKDGTISVKTCYNWLQQNQADSSSFMDSKWRDLWKLKCPSHIQHFLWLLAHGRTLVRANLKARGIDISGLCPLCQQEEKTITHLFTSCSCVSPIWKALSYAYRVQPPSYVVSLDWILEVLKLKA
ncbi:hypothetical protein MKX03_011816 [Papaver bracteatum]|nr:hypothetical protein MKX03_011816 [Papaver bracteatum]